MTGPEHYRAAEKLLGQAVHLPADELAPLIAEAQVHATLALADATRALGWYQAAVPAAQRVTDGGGQR